MVDTVSPIADGPLESDSWQNALIYQENTIRYFRFQACLMNKPGLYETKNFNVENHGNPAGRDQRRFFWQAPAEEGWSKSA